MQTAQNGRIVGLTKDWWPSETSSMEGRSDAVSVHGIRAGLGSKVSFRLQGNLRKSWNIPSRTGERTSAAIVMPSDNSERESA